MTNKEISNLFATIKTAEISFHYAHLMTTSYAFHLATGDFYDSMRDALDSLVETWQGKTGETIVPVDNVPVIGYSKLDGYLDTLCDEVCTLMDNEKDIDIQDKLIDMSNIINTLKYKKRLK